MIDRAKLEEAIAPIRDWFAEEHGATMEKFFNVEELSLVVKAAEAHLAALPKTKMVEVWRVEYATDHPDGPLPKATHHRTRALADSYANYLRACGDTHCVGVTGPHQQEVPA
jgi:hypothetical protein